MNIASSTILAGTVTVNYDAFRGPTGPTGATGATGATGPTGPTGATGNSVYGFNPSPSSDGITVYLEDGTQIYLSGLSGNTYTDFYNATYLYNIIGSTGTVLNESFNVKGSVTGLTATFKPIIGLNGMSLTYTGNDLKFAVTIPAGAAIGVSGAGLRSDGKTAGTFDSTVFKYEENVVGSTTINIAKIKITQFAQANTSYNKNITSTFPTIDNVLTSTNGRKNTSFHQINLTSGTTFPTNSYVSTEWSKINNNNVAAGLTLQFRDQLIFDNTIPYSFEYGSCCFCNGDPVKKCIDYVNAALCTTLDGIFSFNSCATRRTLQECKDIGACCKNGNCSNTDYATCNRIDGDFDSRAYCEGKICTTDP
jgi:hypothetical protein